MGREFNEDEIKVIWWPDEKLMIGFGSFESSEISDSLEEFYEHGYIQNHIDEICFQILIKCPNCKYYH